MTVRLRDGRTGHVFTQRARYLLGFDGARSADRRADRAAVRGRARPRRHRLHHLQRRPEPLRRAPAEHPALDLQLEGRLRRDRHGPAARHPALERVDRRLGLRHRQRRARTCPTTLVLDRIRTLVGDPDLEVEIVRKSLWYVNQQHATNYQVGRVFCGGDAVHRHPPSSGLGSNTSMQDAFNLAWKVAFVVKGHAGAGPARLLHPRAGPGRQADRRPRQPVPQGLRRPAASGSTATATTRSRDGLAKLKEAEPGGRRAAASGSTRRWS